MLIEISFEMLDTFLPQTELVTQFETHQLSNIY
ncbi:Uncharacterised protein [Legionella quinlivanii]|nr:Uncharacterised protein [Legionella quinlivanii]